MLDYVMETDVPRFCIEVRECVEEWGGDSEEEDNAEALSRLRDYIAPDFPMEEYCRKYGRMLRFDSIERSERWEEIVYEVKKECAHRLEGEQRCMDFCF